MLIIKKLNWNKKCTCYLSINVVLVKCIACHQCVFTLAYYMSSVNTMGLVKDSILSMFFLRFFIISFLPTPSFEKYKNLTDSFIWNTMNAMKSKSKYWKTMFFFQTSYFPSSILSFPHIHHLFPELCDPYWKPFIVCT